MGEVLDSKRNLMLGILSLQMELIGSDDLIEAVQKWGESEASVPFGKALVEHGRLSDRSRELLEQLVEEQLGKCEGELSVAATTAMSFDSSLDSKIHSLDDEDVMRTLLAVAQGPASPSQAGRMTSQGRFAVDRLHAKGGLGEVYLADDQELHRQVALKQIKPDIADHPSSRRRFLIEAEITAQLEHPSIVPVYGMGEGLDGRLYYAMKFIHGDSLRDKIKKYHDQTSDPEGGSKHHAITLRDLLGHFVTICNAMEFAHSRGIIHRDIKPANVMLGEYGETLVVDWGLAKALKKKAHDTPTADVDSHSDSADSALETAMGRPLGTLVYASPEQVTGLTDKVGPASDVYSLGATLHHILTGNPPFSGTPESVIADVAAGRFDSPKQVDPTVSGGLDAISKKAMATRIEDRYESCGEIADDINAWLADEPISIYQDSIGTRLRRWVQRHQATSSGVIAAAAVALIGLTISTLLISGKNGELKALNQDLDIETKKSQASFEEAQMASVELASRRGEWKTARERVELAIEKNFQSVDPIALRVKRVEALYAEFSGEEYVKAATELFESKEYGDYEAQILLLYSDSILARGQDAKARPLLERALELKQLERDEELYAQAILEETTLETIALLEQVLDLDTYHLRAHHMLITNLLMLGLLEKADFRLRVARQIFPDDRNLDLLEAWKLALAGRPKSAAKQLASLEGVVSKDVLDLLETTFTKLGLAVSVMDSWNSGDPDIGYKELVAGYIGFKQLVDPAFVINNKLSVVFARSHSTAALAAYTKVLAVMAEVTVVPAFLIPTTDQPLDEALAAHPDAFLFFLMGTKGIFDGDFAAAVKYFKQATANPSMVPHVEREAWFAYAMCLGKLYLDSGFTDQALIADALAAAHRRVELGELDSVDASQLIAIGLRGEDYDLIDDIVTEQLLRNPRNVGFLQSKMKADFGRQRFANVIATCDKVLEIDAEDQAATKMKQAAKNELTQLVADLDDVAQ